MISHQELAAAKFRSAIAVKCRRRECGDCNMMNTV
jgi:hypothetical protein